MRRLRRGNRARWLWDSGGASIIGVTGGIPSCGSVMEEEFAYIPDVVPVFPLTQVVLFPGTLLPLHIFEPRYLDMTADALAGEQMIAAALLKPGFQPLYYTRKAPIYPTIGVGRIVGHEKVAGGEYNILLRGIARARIIEEPDDCSYRTARVEPMETFCSSGETRTDELRSDLLDVIRDNPSLDDDLREHWVKLFTVPLELDELADLIAAGVPTEAELRQCLLDELDASTRVELLLDQLRTLAAIQRNLRRMNADGGPGMN